MDKIGARIIAYAAVQHKGFRSWFQSWVIFWGVRGPCQDKQENPQERKYVFLCIKDIHTSEWVFQKAIDLN